MQATAGRPIVDEVFIPHNAGEGSDFLSLNVRVNRTLHLTGRVQLEVLTEGLTSRIM
jgi:hypothetical protein